MHRPYPLDLALAAPGQLGSRCNAVTRRTQRDDAVVNIMVGFAARVFPGLSRQLNALPLSLTPVFIVVMGYL